MSARCPHPAFQVSMRGFLVILCLCAGVLTGKCCNNDLSSDIFYGSLMCKLKKCPVFDGYVKVIVLADVVVQIYIQSTYI